MDLVLDNVIPNPIDVAADFNGYQFNPLPDTSGASGFNGNIITDESVPLFALDANLLNANPVFMSYLDTEKMKDIFTIDTFFKPIFDVALSAENVLAIKTNLSSVALKNNERFTIDRANFVGEPSVEDVAVSVDKITNNPLLELQDLIEMFDSTKIKLNSEFKNYIDADTKQIRDEITSNHTLMHQYMDTIISSISIHYFIKSQLKIQEKLNVMFPVNSDNAQYMKNIKRAAAIVAGMKVDVIDDLGKGLTEAYDEIFKSIADLTAPVIKDYVKSIGNTEQIKTSAFYYTVRKHMLNYVQKSGSSGCANALRIVKATEGNEVYLYATKLMVDLYLNVCTPLVQYSFASSLMKKYMYAGDFVNTRTGLLSKIFYIVIIYYTLNTAIPTLKNQISTTNFNNNIASTQTFISEVLTKFNLYLENMNRIDIKSKTTTSETELQKIIDELKQYSNDVTKQSAIISEKKKNIQESRLAMRSILYNITIIQQNRKKKLIEFYVILSILIIVTLACVALLILKMNDYVFYVAGATLMGILLYNLILLIIYFVRKN